LKADVYAKLENTAKIKGLTPEQLASQIILRKSKSCHGCGLEWENCPTTHEPATPDKFPCNLCSRNPVFPQQMNFKGTDVKDRWSELWTLDADGKPFIER